MDVVVSTPFTALRWVTRPLPCAGAGLTSVNSRLLYMLLHPISPAQARTGLDTAIKESVRFSEEDAHDPLLALSGV